MNIDLDDRQRGIVDEAAEFARTVLAPRAQENDEKGVFPREVLKQMAERGYLGATVPQEYGGLGLDPVAYGLLVAAIESGDCAASRLLTVHVALVAEAILKCASTEQIREWIPRLARGETICAFALTEPDHGSDAAGIQTAYTVHGDEFRLNGRKRWITFSGIADLLLVIARNEETVSAFLIESATEGVRIIPQRGLMAGKACHISEVVLEDVVVSKKNMIGQPGQGFTYVVNAALDHGRYSIAWSGVGLAEAAVDAMVSYAKKRSQFGAKIGTFQLVREMIAEAVARVYAAKSLCLRAGETRRAGKPDSIIESTIAKHFAAGAAFRTACDAVQIHGGNGFSNEYPVERYMREAKVLEIIEGTAQIQQMVISMHGLRRFGRG
ncbi:MAG: acyl-CoA dehydrogenase family protein [Gammaproteobacteria bacterium]|jgi:alkylation response protein AidB-like acyl-CoA dehydrogenase|nr:acyl-CoA dehydrogenase family protein [Gammaproteobacteria bacterium]